VRVVVDRRLRLPPTSRLAATAREVPVWVLAGPEADQRRAADLAERGVEILPLSGDGAAAALAALGARGITRVLAEGGARLAAALLRERLVDRLYLFEAPLLLGAEALPGVGDLGVERLAEAPRWRRVAEVPLGDDRLAVLDAAG
jgi:diaminohydroxyphosphoribosylaminopyrimidine deaminase/5-amino-6-(5-phosphoribosylamino)uracil reductase